MPSRSRGGPKAPAERRAASLTTTQRGLGHDHRQNRERLLTRHVDGRRCWWCAKPMFKDAKRNWDGFALEADHTKGRARFGPGKTRADRLLHKTCNIQRGDGTKDHERPALVGTVDTSVLDTDLGPLAMGWPW